MKEGVGADSLRAVSWLPLCACLRLCVPRASAEPVLLSMEPHSTPGTRPSLIPTCRKSSPWRTLPSDFLGVRRPHNVSTVLGKLIYGKSEAGIAVPKPPILSLEMQAVDVTSWTCRTGSHPEGAQLSCPIQDLRSHVFILTEEKCSPEMSTVRTVVMSSQNPEHKMHLKKF